MTSVAYDSYQLAIDAIADALPDHLEDVIDDLNRRQEMTLPDIAEVRAERDTERTIHMQLPSVLVVVDGGEVTVQRWDGITQDWEIPIALICYSAHSDRVSGMAQAQWYALACQRALELATAPGQIAGLWRCDVDGIGADQATDTDGSLRYVSAVRATARYRTRRA